MFRISRFLINIPFCADTGTVNIKIKINFLLQFLVLTALLYSADNSVSLTIIRSMAESKDPNQKLEALQSLENMINKGGLSSEDDDGVLSILTFLACEGIVNVSLDELRIDNDHGHVRNEAVRVLGLTGHPRALDSLLTVLLHEPVTYVLSTAVRSCGNLGLTHPKLNSVYYMILTGKRKAYRNDSLVYDTLLSLEMLREKDEYLLASGDLREGVIQVSDPGSGFLRKTRKLAEKLIKSK